jgi:tRNA(adenine34) deaminase
MSKQEFLPFDIAFQEAQQAALEDDVPVGAVIILEGKIIAQAGNRVERNHDPTAHAEILVIREAAALLKTPRLVGCDLYVTLEPCAMCAQAMAHARIRRLYFGAYDPKGGGVEHGSQVFSQKTCHHRPEVVGGVREQECGQLLREFFQARR